MQIKWNTSTLAMDRDCNRQTVYFFMFAIDMVVYNDLIPWISIPFR